MALALEQNNQLRASALLVDRTETLKGTAFEFDKAEIYYNYDENNLALNGDPLNVFGVQQSFDFPTVYGAKSKLQNAKHEYQKNIFELKKKEFFKSLSLAYHNYQTLNQKAILYKTLDSIYSKFSNAANRRFELGETNYLEKVTAKAKAREIANNLSKIEQQMKMAYNEIAGLVQSGDSLQITLEKPKKLPLENATGLLGAETSFLETRQQLSLAKKRLEENRLFPDISLEYFQGTNNGLGTSLYGVQLGLRIPIFFFGHSSRVKSSKIDTKITSLENRHLTIATQTKYENLMNTLKQRAKELNYYEEEGNLLSKEITKAAQGNFQNGEIDFFQYIQSLENAFQIELNHLDALNQYNQTVIAINYLTITL